jgi:hypothetical protein
MVERSQSRLRREYHCAWFVLLTACELDSSAIAGVKRMDADASTKWRPDSLPGDGMQGNAGAGSLANGAENGSKSGGGSSDAGTQNNRSNDKPSVSRPPGMSPPASSGPMSTTTTAGTPTADAGMDASTNVNVNVNGGTAGDSASIPRPDTSSGQAGQPGDKTVAAGAEAPDQSGPKAGSGDGADESGTLAALLIVAAAQTLRGRAQAGQTAIWLALAGDGTQLNPPLVSNVLDVLLATGACFRNPVPCAQVCVIISQDCKPCVADETCRMQLTNACGRSVAACGESAAAGTGGSP